ncbi:MAG TPA: DEAD/DEAH box helicase, partial [archaeon]|nr:DEAD/DEAH box helicase [archaeon]
MVFKTFSEKMQKLIEQKGFIEPTLPQTLGIPEIASGNNILVIAPTGIGKTEVAILPIFDKIYQNKLKPISLLYVTPLKSLNRDLLDRLFWWGDKLEIEIAVRHGDTDQKERASQREAPPNCLITTPETLQAILTGKIFREHLKNVKCVVIDEIHELVGSKRGVQLSLGLERLKQLSGNFQRIGLSATVGSPEIVAEFLGEKVKIIRAESQKRYDIRVETPRPDAKDQDISDDLVIGVSTTARLRRLYELITSHKSVIAFTNTRETAEVISSRLAKLDRELKQAVHHGSLSKESRVKSETDFKGQKLKSLIATSSLELGIDIGSIDLVVQYLSPRQAARLIQRVGRAGHRIDEVSKG